MRIVSLQVNANQLTLLGDNQKVFSFEDNVNIVFSTKNSVGKTTLLRLLMYALGYPIPSTRGIRFSDYETILKVVGANDEISGLDPQATRRCFYRRAASPPGGSRSHWRGTRCRPERAKRRDIRG